MRIGIAQKLTFKHCGCLALISIGLLVGLLGFGSLAISQMNSEAISVATANQANGISGVALSLFLQLRAEEINRPISSDSNPISFSIEAGESAAGIADRLQALGLIEDSLLFRLFLRYNGLDTSLEAGDYTLRSDMSLKQVALTLQQGRLQEIVVTIPEGWRAEQIAAHFIENQVMAGDQFLALVQSGQGIDHPLLAQHPPGQSYEGYLYPDTYRLPVDMTAPELIGLMLDTLAAKLPAETEALTQQQGLTFHQALTLAAIIEREAVLDEERPMIASVYLNRLKAPRNYLESDATAQYAIGYQPDSGQWWKTPVTLEELRAADSPYNTYLYPGLPPGPIANPGIASIQGVLQPAQTDFLFYVCARPNCQGGNHIFAKTYEEHLRNVENYYGR